MKYAIQIFILFLLTSCASRTVYLNKSEHYKLVLKSDSSYFFKQPALIHRYTERGTYQIKNDSVLLINRYENLYDSIAGNNTEITFSGPPDSVSFSFRNMNDTAIAVSFRINGSPTVFKTDQNGECKFAYQDMLEKNILDSNLVFRSFDIVFNGHDFHYVNEIRPISISLPTAYPVRIEFTLNQYAGKKYGYSYRRYACSRDSIIVNTSTWKGMPKAVVLKKR